MSGSLLEQLNSELAGTPYSLTSESDAVRANAVRKQLGTLRRLVSDLQLRRMETTKETRERLEQLQRARLLVESSRIESIELDFRETFEALNEIDTSQPRVTLTKALSGDPSITNRHTLAWAHEMGERLAKDLTSPFTAPELRELHRAICQGERHAGSFRPGDIIIGGAQHIPPPSADMQADIVTFLEWFNTSREANPLVASVVAHTWLTHLHPFEDGNGRIARLLANVALARKDWPPVVIRSGAAKMQYYDALAASDEAGDILDITALFILEARRSLDEQISPEKAVLAIERQFVESQGHAAWTTLAERFVAGLREHGAPRGLDVVAAGLPDATDFEFLRNRNPAGNGWLVKIRSRGAWAEVPINVVLWFGFVSEMLIETGSVRHNFPSIFFSVRDTSPSAIHPYRHVRPDDHVVLDEIYIRQRLDEDETVVLRSGRRVREMSIEEAVPAVVDVLVGLGRPVERRRKERHADVRWLGLF